MKLDEKEKFEFKFEALKNARKTKGLKQEELAKMIFTTRQSISNWENGKKIPTLENVNRLSEILDISMDDLIIRKVEEAYDEETLGSRVNNNYNVSYLPIISRKTRKDLKVIKRILIAILIILIIYLGTSIRKFCILTDIKNKMVKYENVDNYHLTTDYIEIIDEKYTNCYIENLYVFKDTIKKVVEYKECNNYVKEISYINKERKIIIDSENKTYEIIEGNEQYDNLIMKKNISTELNSSIINLLYSFNPFLRVSSYINYDLNYKGMGNKLKKNERINKETGLIEEQITQIDENRYIKRQFEMEVNTITSEDVEIPNLDEYKLK